jgi:hypothetical protein
MERRRAKAVGFPAYRQAGKALERGSLGMGKHCWLKAEWFHTFGGGESRRLKVAALIFWKLLIYPASQKTTGFARG